MKSLFSWPCRTSRNCGALFSTARHVLLSLVCLITVVGYATAQVVAQSCPASMPISQPSADFDLSKNGGATVFHAPTGLTWMRCSVGQTWNGSACTGTPALIIWKDALARSTTELLFGGGWRLPNINELKSIADDACVAPSINASVFPKTALANYWSSSSFAGDATQAWTSSFDTGLDGVVPKQSSAYARLVRGGKFLTNFDFFNKQEITFGATPSRTFGDRPFKVSATGGASGNPVVFSSATPSVCTAGDINGATITIVASGICKIIANQASSDVYLAAPAVTQSISIFGARLVFESQANVPLSTPIISNAVTIVGLVGTLPIEVFEGSYLLGCTSNNASSGAFVTTPGTVKNGDTICLKQVSGEVLGKLTRVSISIIGPDVRVDGSFDVITGALPASINFVPATNVPANADVISNAIVLSGFTGSVPISIVGGSYFVGCSPANYAGPFTAAVTTVKAGDTVCLKVTSGGSGQVKLGTLTIGSAGAAVTGVFSVTTKTDVPPLVDTPEPQAVDRYRISIPSTRGHLYTTDANEYDTLINNAPNLYIDEGVDHRVYPSSFVKAGQATVPFYRLYSIAAQQHFWTADANEYNVHRANSAAYRDDGISCYVFAKAGVPGTIPLYRVVLNGTAGTAVHFWTADANEFNSLIANGWSAEGALGNPVGVSAYVLPKIPEEPPVKRYRFNVPSTNAHFFTTDENEYQKLKNLPSTYVDEGVAHRVYKSPITKGGLTAVPYYRVYFNNLRQHFWTIDVNEYNILRADKVNTVDEGIDSYIFRSEGVVTTIPLYRLVLTGTAIHHWTSDKNEFDVLIQNGWTAEGTLGPGVAGYVVRK